MQAPAEHNKTIIVVTWDCITLDGVTCGARSILRELNRLWGFKIVIASSASFSLGTIGSELSSITEKEIYTPISIDFKLPNWSELHQGKKPELTDVIEFAVLPDYNKSNPQNPFKLTDIILLDNNQANLENATKKGIRSIKLDARDFGKNTFMNLADQILQSDVSFKKAKQDLKTLKSKSEVSKEFVQQAEQNLQKTCDGYLKSGNSLRVILTYLQIAKFYELVHTVNYGMSAKDRLATDFRAKRIQPAQQIFELLNNDMLRLYEKIPVEHKPLLRNQITILFNAVFDQLSSYSKYGNIPTEITELLSPERTLDDLIKQFYVELDEQLRLQSKEMREAACLIM